MNSPTEHQQAGAPEEDGLFVYDAPPPVSLADRFGVPPFSILDRRAGEWQARRRRWLSLGIESELGRANDLLAGKNCAYGSRTIMRDDEGQLLYAGEQIEEGSGKTNHYAYGAKAISTPDGLVYEVAQGATSVFDPVVCELAYRWYVPPGGLILDPFAGGSVRGIVAALLERNYMGIDLRPEQVQANRQQVGILPEGKKRWAPRWAAGDSLEVLRKVPPNSVDFVWSCPPYADLEVYSDDPRDLSTMSYSEFLAAHREIVGLACRALRPNRFAAWVISDVRDRRGNYRGLNHSAVEHFREAGLDYYNEGIILDPVGSAAVRAARIFNGGRKLTRMHQYLLIFVKGDAKQATRALGESEQMSGGAESE